MILKKGTNFKKEFMGITEQGNLYEVEVELRYRNDQYTISISGNENRPFVVREGDMEDLATNLLEEHIEILNDHRHSSFYDMVETMASNWENEILVDNSLFPLVLEVEGKEVAFSSESCGQNEELLDTVIEGIEPSTIEFLKDLWRKSHLEEITWEETKELYRKLEELGKGQKDGEEVAKEFVENNIDNIGGIFSY